MRFELEGFAPIDDPPPELVENGLHTLDRAERAYAVLEQRPATYVRAARAGDGGYVLEVQDGSAEQCYQASQPVPLEDLVSVFGAYLRQEDDWRSRFEWRGKVIPDPHPDPDPDPDVGEAWVPLELTSAIRVGVVLLGVTALGIFLAVFGHSRTLVSVGLLGAVFCGIFGLLLLGTGVMAVGRGLRLDREGFAIVSRRRTQRHAWGDVAAFSLVKTSRGRPLVGYTLRDHGLRTRPDDVSRWLWGVSDGDGVVPSSAIRPEVLIVALEAWRVRYQDRR